MSTEKIRPSELGCNQPYRLSLKGKIIAGHKDLCLLQSYIAAYRQTVQNIVRLLRSMVDEGGPSEVLAYLLIFPSRVPKHISTSLVWAELENSTGPDGLNLETWALRVKNSVYQLLRSLADPNSRPTIGGDILNLLVRKYKLCSISLDKKVFDDCYRLLCRAGERTAATVDAVGILKSFYSSCERVAQINQARQAVVADKQSRYPDFFKPFYRYYTDQIHWIESCHGLDVLRRSLLEQGIERSLLYACQRRAIRLRPDLISWQPLLEETDLECQLADSHDAIVKSISANLPEATSTCSFHHFHFRRFSKPGLLTVLAQDPYHIRKVLDLYDQAFGLFEDDTEKRAILEDITPHKHSLHRGWLNICSSTDPRWEPLKAFVSKDLKEFVMACHLVKEPEIKDPIEASPLIQEGKRGWQWLEEEGKNRNELIVSLIVPAHIETVFSEIRKRTSLKLRLRGNFSITKGESLETPLEVLYPRAKFRPNRYLNVRCSSRRRHTYFKAQSLRLIDDSDALWAVVFCTYITEAVTPPKQQTKRVSSLNIGERIAVFHYLPGGLRLGSMAILERAMASTPTTDFKMISFREQITRTDSVAYENGKNGRLPKIRRYHSGHKKRLIVHFDMDSFEKRIDSSEAQRLEDARGLSPIENVQLSKRYGAYRKNLGQTVYRQVASRIGRICVENNVSYLLFAGGGTLRGASGLLHPVHSFFTLSQDGQWWNPSGYLIDTLNKAGVRLFWFHARAHATIARDYRHNPKISCLHIGVPFHVESERAETRGRKNYLFHPKTGKVLDYAQNSIWSIFYSWCSKKYERMAEQANDESPWTSFSPPSQRNKSLQDQLQASGWF